MWQPNVYIFFGDGAAFVSFSALYVILKSGISDRTYVSIYIHIFETCHETALISSSVGGRMSSFCSCSGIISESVWAVA
uniref:Uncharacterized protein n=1 Tax=Arundo donax TaxID=35708 RepID=A0A0A9E917_ARUDO